jgi:hypothetical protein
VGGGGATRGVIVAGQSVILSVSLAGWLMPACLWAAEEAEHDDAESAEEPPAASANEVARQQEAAREAARQLSKKVGWTDRALLCTASF